MKNIGLTLLVALAMGMPLAAADIAGTWTVNGDVAGYAVNMKCVFKTTQASSAAAQSAVAIAGTCSGERGTTPATGTVTGNNVAFVFSVDNGQVWELHYSGAFDKTGNSIEGEVVVGRLSGTFLAARQTSGDSAGKAAADPSGAWTITGEVVGNNINMKCRFKLDEAKVLGTCTYEGLGDSDTVGTVAGDRITFQNQVQREQLYALTYSGTLDATGKSMKGEIAVSGVTGTFSGTKDN